MVEPGLSPQALVTPWACPLRPAVCMALAGVIVLAGGRIEALAGRDDRQSLVRETEAVLARIRETHPEVEGITARARHAPGVLLVGLAPELLRSASGDEAFDRLGREFGLRSITVPEATGTAVPDRIAGDDVRHVTFREAWGDCPSGCLFERLHRFEVAGDGVRKIDAEAAWSLDIAFDGNWREQEFPFLSANAFVQEGATLRILSDDSVSVLWRHVQGEARDARLASWRWTVERGVPATDLTRKGGDDRNVALYFLFLPRERAEGMEGASLERILRDTGVRALVYVRGGSHAPGEILASPYMDTRGVTIPLRGTELGERHESVDLHADYRRAFASSPGVLFGLGVSADSDDTASAIEAELSDLVLAR